MSAGFLYVRFLENLNSSRGPKDPLAIQRLRVGFIIDGMIYVKLLTSKNSIKMRRLVSHHPCPSTAVHLLRSNPAQSYPSPCDISNFVIYFSNPRSTTETMQFYTPILLSLAAIATAAPAPAAECCDPDLFFACNLACNLGCRPSGLGGIVDQSCIVGCSQQCCKFLAICVDGGCAMLTGRLRPGGIAVRIVSRGVHRTANIGEAVRGPRGNFASG